METLAAFLKGLMHARDQVQLDCYASAYSKDPNGARKGSIWQSVVNIRIYAFVQIHGLNIDMHFNPASRYTDFLNPIPGF